MLKSLKERLRTKVVVAMFSTAADIRSVTSNTCDSLASPTPITLLLWTNLSLKEIESSMGSVRL